MTADSLHFEFTAAPDRTGGPPVRFVLKATNATGRPLTLHLRGRVPTLDVVVRTEMGGPVVWRRLEEGALPSILQMLTLRPGDSLVATVLWDGRTTEGAWVDEGEYLAEAHLLTDGEPLRPPPIRFRLDRSSALRR